MVHQAATDFLNNMCKFLLEIFNYLKVLTRILVGVYCISTIVNYLMPKPVYTYILNIYDLVCLGFMAYQPLLIT